MLCLLNCCASPPVYPQVDMMFDATCDRIREVAHENELPLPDALRPDAVPRTKMYHVSGR